MESKLLRVITLNCWGIPLPDWTRVVKDRKLRIEAIGRELAKADYDLVALQEIWSEDDFAIIRDLSADTLPYSHYFHSGVIGSGLCVFSKFEFLETMTYRYSLNGFPHHLHVGDWFGGKGIGLAQIRINLENSNLTVNVYCTHIHAEYDRANDPYLAHRLVQAFELSQFIKHTSVGADLVIALGDFNLEPIDLGYDIIRKNAQLLDSWVERSNQEEIEKCLGNTCERPDNRYGDHKVQKQYPHGKRIDYIMYRATPGLEMTLNSCEIKMNKIPETEYNFSDHAAVFSEFRISKTDLGQSNSDVEIPDPNQRNVARSATRSYFERTLNIVQERNRMVGRDRMFYSGYIFALLFLFFQIIGVELQYPSLAVVAIICRFILTLLVGFCLWHGIIGLTLERKSLKGCVEGMRKLLK